MTVIDRPTYPPLTHVARALETQGRRHVWLAARLGISKSYLALILAGRRPLRDDHAAVMAEALGLPLELIKPPVAAGKEI